MALMELDALERLVKAQEETNRLLREMLEKQAAPTNITNFSEVTNQAGKGKGKR